MMRFTKCLLLLLLLMCGTIVQAQIPTGGLPAGLNIDQLTDQQLTQFLQSVNLNGMSDADLEAKAKEKGLSPDQIQKLKARVQALGLNTTQGKQDTKTTNDNLDRKGINYLLPKAAPDSINGLLIYGSEIFTRENLTFEPNLNIPSPVNYVLGAGDELKIDVYGFSDKNISLKVTPEGVIRYPNLGPVKVAGLSLEDARAMLSSKLAQIYPGLKSGNTKLQVSLGQIRSIKVNIIGEVRKPGSYTLSSFSTIANALYASGGPTLIGSYRNIELVRGGKTISKFDLYSYLMKGDLTANKVLQDEDVIRVAPYSSRIEVRGAIKRSAIYELSSEDRLENILTYTGGFADNALKDVVRISRYGKREKEMVTLAVNESKNYPLQTGDMMYVDTMANVYRNRVTIGGAIYYPGAYSLDNVSSLKELLVIARLKEDAFKDRGFLRRYKENYVPEVQGFNVVDVLNGVVDYKLRRDDSVHIYMTADIKQTNKVLVKGEVNRPDSFYYAQGMKVQDAVFMAGGFKDGASRKLVEVSRRVRDTSSATASNIYSVILNVNLSQKDSADALNTLLEPFDIIFIRKSPGYKEQINVSIQGEVNYPGEFSITSNQERLSDLVKRAGGLKTGAYAEGAFMLRRTYDDLSTTDTIMYQNRITTLVNSSTDTVKVNNLAKNLNSDMRIVGIRLNDVLEKAGSKYDIILQDGDILKIPKQVETVQSLSGVYIPKKIVFRPGITIKDVIRESGGALNGGQKFKSYAILPNGEIRTTKHFLFFKSYPSLKPGSEVYVPVKKNSKLTTVELVAITTGIATLGTMLVTVFTLTK